MREREREREGKAIKKNNKSVCKRRDFFKY
jgi:hypothetical protein